MSKANLISQQLQRRLLERDILFLQETLEKELVPAVFEGVELNSLKTMLEQDLANKIKIQRNIIDTEEKEANMAAQRHEVFVIDSNGNSIPIIVDWIIVTAAEQEGKAVRTYLNANSRNKKKAVINEQLAHLFEYSTPYDKVVRILVVCTQRQRKDSMKTLLVDIARLDKKPFAVIMVGMMGGIPGKKVKLLDVVVPDSIWAISSVSVENGKLVTEPSPSGSQHPRIKKVITNIEPEEYGATITVNSRKNIISTIGKIDDLETELAKALLKVDPENAIGFEQEGEALVQIMSEQQVSGANVIYGLVKGVADYCSTGKKVTTEECENLKQQVPSLESFENLDPTGDPKVKAILQKEATIRALNVTLAILNNLELTK